MLQAQLTQWAITTRWTTNYLFNFVLFFTQCDVALSVLKHNEKLSILVLRVLYE